MNFTNHFDVIIIGGGLAGLTTAIHLSNQKIKVLVIEKQEYPHHKVCGEYVSNEVLPYLQKLGVDPITCGAVKISKFKITDTSKVAIETSLDLGGFGISRYAFDQLLYEKARETANFIFDTVEDITFKDNKNIDESIFTVTTQLAEKFTTKYLVGAFGKRSNIDKVLNRNFIEHKTCWMAIKAHYQYEMPNNQVELHNFKGGYCGLSKTETGAVNACYLVKVEEFKKYKNIETFQKEHLSQNEHLKEFFKKAQPIFKKPITISQISFAKKNPVINHIFMLGDSAGLIHPLVGNGMSMAIHSAKIFSELFLEFNKLNKHDRAWLEKAYSDQWNNTFKSRLKTGGIIQRLLLNDTAASFSLKIAKVIPSIISYIIKRTHGSPLV